MRNSPPFSASNRKETQINELNQINFFEHLVSEQDELASEAPPEPEAVSAQGTVWTQWP